MVRADNLILFLILGGKIFILLLLSMMLAVGFRRCWFYIDALYRGEEILFCEKLTLPKERSGLYPQLLEVTFMPVGVSLFA